jgi:uncharacterized NAD(P)/FAD-binding protein YdhS
MANKTVLQEVEQDIENFVLKVEKKLEPAIHSACEQALGYIEKAELLLNNGGVIAFEKIVPAAAVAAPAILAILQGLQKDFQAVATATQPVVVAGAGAAIAAAIHGSGASATTFIAPYAVVSGAVKAS